MAQSEIAAFVAAKTKSTKALVNKTVDQAFEFIASRLAKGQRLRIPALGTFTVVQRKARMGRNPRTGATINIPARKTIKFKASAALQERLKKLKL